MENGSVGGEKKVVVIFSSPICGDGRCTCAYVSHVYLIKLCGLIHGYWIICHVSTPPVSISSSSNGGEYIARTLSEEIIVSAQQKYHLLRTMNTTNASLLHFTSDSIIKLLRRRMPDLKKSPFSSPFQIFLIHIRKLPQPHQPLISHPSRESRNKTISRSIFPENQ